MTVPSGPPAPDASSFDAFYFSHCCGRRYGRDPELLAFFARVADLIVGTIGPRRVLDAGCAFGFLVEALRERHCDAVGIDLSPYAIAQAKSSIAPYVRVGSLADPLTAGPGDRFDLITCIEVLEHMTPADADQAITHMCAVTDDVIFSSSPFDLREPTHVNVRPPEAWAEAFARHGFYRDPDFDASCVTSWAVRYRRSAEPMPRLIRGLERRFAQSEIAANEARANVVEMQRRHEGLERQVEIAMAQIKMSTAQAEILTARIETLTQALAASERLEKGHRQECEALAHRLAVAEDRAAHMEASAFWRLRNAWVAINRLFGRTR